MRPRSLIKRPVARGAALAPGRRPRQTRPRGRRRSVHPPSAPRGRLAAHRDDLERARHRLELREACAHLSARRDHRAQPRVRRADQPPPRLGRTGPGDLQVLVRAEGVPEPRVVADRHEQRGLRQGAAHLLPECDLVADRDPEHVGADAQRRLFGRAAAEIGQPDPQRLHHRPDQRGERQVLPKGTRWRL